MSMDKLINLEFKNLEYENQVVRDLAWAISTPPIIIPESYSCHWPKSSWFQNAYKETLSWFHELDQDSSTLESLLAKQKDKRLGKYFETLWFYWFDCHPRYDVLAHNLQIIIDGETLGEIDFILYDKKSKKVLHWEVAVKFYLGLSDTVQMSNWHGPNRRDRLDIKVNHLMNKQSQISHDHRVADWLRRQEFVVEQCAVILKGRLYYHYTQFEDNKISDERFNNEKIKYGKKDDINKVNVGAAEKLISPVHSGGDHLHGKWFRQSEFEACFAENQCFVPLINSSWLESLPTDGINNIVAKSEVIETLSNKELRLPLHLQLYKGESEGDKIFLVNENWSKYD